jgi:hypothetical protein
MLRNEFIPNSDMPERWILRDKFLTDFLAKAVGTCVADSVQTARESSAMCRCKSLPAWSQRVGQNSTTQPARPANRLTPDY